MKSMLLILLMVGISNPKKRKIKLLNLFLIFFISIFSLSLIEKKSLDNNLY